MKQLNWFEPGVELSPAELDIAERRLQVKFPADYASMVAAHSGGSNPDESEFEYADLGRVRIGNFGGLLDLREGQSDSVFQALSNLGEQLFLGIIPIIATGSGDYVCLDYRGAPSPSVIYFAHERAGEDAFVHLDATFSNFLQRLRMPGDD